jgi:predicted ATPase/DNA-binding SARP family transcriptional activator
VAPQPILIALAGGCRVATVDGTWNVEVPTRQGRLVLARLALAAGPVTRDELAELVWPERLPRAWERDLSAVVSRLRRVLAGAPGSVATVRGGAGIYELVLPPASAIDVVEAEIALRRACAAFEDDRRDEALAAARSAADIARRPMVPGARSVWLDDRRVWLRSLLAQALALQVEVALARRDASGLGAADEAIATEPISGRAYENAMRLRLALGEDVAALEVYRRYRAAVVDELGLPPAPALEALRAAAQGAVSPGAEPSLASAASTTAAGIGSLPVATTSFVGRRRALRVLEAAFDRSRLVTVTGPAGVGKTRLALEAAHRLIGRRRDGARLCELAHVAHPGGVGAAMVAAIGASSETGIAVEEILIEALASRQMLLVVDNCEHVLPTVAPLLERIVEHCRGVWLLATSRERLAVSGEAVVPLHPLEVPAEVDPNAAWTRPAPALELLADRVKAVRADFTPRSGEEVGALVEVCRRLDGLPLAIELAATRMASMAPLDVAQRLERRLAVLTSGRRTAPSRHGTLRAAIEWSYDLLTDVERYVFERAAVFAGGFTLAAAERVCAEGHGVRPDEIANVLAALVDKSLVVLDDRYPATRYQLLETLREFARERLAARDDLDAAARAHAEYFAALADTAEPHIRGPAEGEWVAVVEAETSNFRVAHAWARRSRAVELAASLSADLAWFGFWRMRTEMLSWAEPLADLAEASRATRHVEALAVGGRSAWMRGDLARSQVLVEQAIDTTDDRAARFAWHVLGDVHLFRGDLRAAAAAYERADELSRQAGDAYHCALLRGCRALVCTYAGDATRALDLAHESRAEAELSGSFTALAWSDYVTGEGLPALELERALDHLERASEIAGRVANEFIAGVAGLSAASLVARHGDLAAAARTFVGVIDRFEHAGNWRQQWTAMRQAVELLARLSQPRAAAMVLGAVEQADADNIFGDDAERLGRLGDELRAALGQSFDAAIRAGRSLDRSDVIAFVRHELGDQGAAAVAHSSP